MWLNQLALEWTAFHPVMSDWPSDWVPRQGIYRLVAFENGAPRPIPRVCGEDELGTLYIGQTSTLEGRINSLRRILRTGNHGAHSAGNLFITLTRLRERFPNTVLATTWALTDEPLAAEAALIGAYAATFGEAPPLNRQWAAGEL